MAAACFWLQECQGILTSAFEHQGGKRLVVTSICTHADIFRPRERYFSLARVPFSKLSAGLVVTL